MSEMINCNLSNQAIFVLNDFHYIDNTLIVLSATSGGVSIISFESVIGAPAGIASACLTLVFFRKTGIKKSLTNKKQ